MLCLVLVVVKVFRQDWRVNGTLGHFINREVRRVRTAVWKEEGKRKGRGQGKEEEEEVVGGRGKEKKRVSPKMAVGTKGSAQTPMTSAGVGGGVGGERVHGK